MLKLDNDVHTIFFTMGFNCNFKCKYCLQFAVKENFIRETYNKDIINFIKFYADKRKKEKKSPLHVQFFGGEPLLYFHIMKDAVARLKDLYVSFGIITNASLLDEEKVKFLNDNDFNVAISWDGRNTKLSRLVDVLQTNKEQIFKIKKPYISSVMSAYTYPKELLEDIVKFDEEYKKINNTNFDVPWNIDFLYNFNNPNQSDVFNIDFDKIRNQVTEMAHNFVTKNKKNHPIEDIFISRYIDMIRGYVEYDETLDNKKYSMCGNGYSTLNLDMEGNLYLCHDSLHKKLGNIYSDKESYMKNYFLMNNVAPNYFKTTCKDCNVRFICNGGCMLLTEDERKKFYCPQRKAVLEPIIHELLLVK